MFAIATVSYNDAAAPAKFARSLHETGFAVLTDHPITPERIEATYASWGAFFNSQAKFEWMPADGAQDGYFPFRSENAKDATAKDLKEFYHVYPRGKVPPDLEAQTRALHSDLVAVGATLLGWLQDQSPQAVTEALSEPLPRMLAGSEQNLLRILHYPPLEEAPEPGAVRAAAHGDINLDHLPAGRIGARPRSEGYGRQLASGALRPRNDGDQCGRHARYGDAGLLPCYGSPGR